MLQNNETGKCLAMTGACVGHNLLTTLYAVGSTCNEGYLKLMIKNMTEGSFSIGPCRFIK